MSLYCAGSHYEDGVIDYELFYEHAHQFMAASFIEVGGRTGLGYRDTAQDAMTIPTPTWKCAGSGFCSSSRG